MEDGRSPDKIKRRPRPEPLVIPPSIYSNISPFQSHLRSPIRLLENPLALPPYTPPPILSPVREGSGLYFSTFLSSIAAGNQGLPLPPTPKTASKSLLRSSEQCVYNSYSTHTGLSDVSVRFGKSAQYALLVFKKLLLLKQELNLIPSHVPCQNALFFFLYLIVSPLVIRLICLSFYPSLCLSV